MTSFLKPIIKCKLTGKCNNQGYKADFSTFQTIRVKLPWPKVFVLFFFVCFFTFAISC